MDVSFTRASNTKFLGDLGNLGKACFFHHKLQSIATAYPPHRRYFSFDAVTAVSFGAPVGFLDARSDVRGLIENMDKAMYRQTLSLYPPISWFARHTAVGRWIFVSQRTDKEGLGLFMKVGAHLLANL